MTYLNSFGPEETYLRKKVETELGTKMIHLKMRCTGIGSEWGKVNTSCLSYCLCCVLAFWRLMFSYALIIKKFLGSQIGKGVVYHKQQQQQQSF
jgi:Domain of unknown function (DUF4370)